MRKALRTVRQSVTGYARNLDFTMPAGGAQLVGCMKVLRDLDAAEEIRLPASTRAKRQVKARRLGYAVDAAEWYYPDNVETH